MSLPRKLIMTACRDLRSRFQGSLAGAVAGDCLGAPFEVTGISDVEELVLFEQQLDTKVLDFTDDTAMARSVAKSLIGYKGVFNAQDMAKRFHVEYVKEPNRGYGSNVIDIFEPISDPNITDVFQPATRQFNGSGSYGNGGAMRVVPVALAFYNDYVKMKQVAIDSARLTHSNCLGYNGALLQCAAVHQALHVEAGTDVDVYGFLDSLIHMMKIDGGGDNATHNQGASDTKKVKLSDTSADNDVYITKLMMAKEFLKKEDITRQEIVKHLGHDVSAHKSVVTAIFCFLRCTKAVNDIPTENALVRTILYAISMDGDTDTLATMAGAIAGAYYGMECIPNTWKQVCEALGDAVNDADELFDLVNTVVVK